MFHLVDFCRLCLSLKGEFNEICNDYIMEKVVACIQDLEFEDRLPALICSNCLEKLDMFFDFRNRCLQSEFLLHSYIDKFLANTSAEFVNTKLQVNVFRDFAAGTERMGNVKVQNDKMFTHRSADASASASETRNNDNNISSEDDDVFLEEEGEVQIKQKLADSPEYEKQKLADSPEYEKQKLADSPEYEKQKLADSPEYEKQKLADSPEYEVEGKTVKRKFSNSSDCTSKKSKVEVRNVMSDHANFEKIFDEQVKENHSARDDLLDILKGSSSSVVTDITERVKLRKRQVQLRAEKKNYCELYDESLSTQTKYDSKEKFENMRKVHSTKNKIKNVLKTPHQNDSTGKYKSRPDYSEMQCSTQTILEKAVEKYYDINEDNTKKLEEVNNSNKKEVVRSNIGISKILAPTQDAIPFIPIATATDYEADITAHHVTSSKDVNNETPNPTNKNVSQLYETNFGNLLKFHLTHNEKPKENKTIPYKVLQSSNNQPIKVVTTVQLQQPQLPAENILSSTLFVVNPTVQPTTKLHTSLDSVPIQLPKSAYWQNSQTNPIYRIVPTITSKSVPVKIIIPKLKSILLSKTERRKARKIKSTANSAVPIPSVPFQTSSNHAVVTKSPDMKTEEVILPFIPQNIATEYTNKSTIRNSDTVYEYSRTGEFSETRPLISITAPQKIKLDIKEIKNDRINPSTAIQETSNVESLRRSLQFDHNYSQCTAPTLKEMLSSCESTDTPQLKKLFDKVEEINPNVTKDLLKNSSSPHFKKHRASFKSSTEDSNSKQARAGRIKKKYRMKREFAIDDPLNVLKLFKQHRGKYKSSKKCAEKPDRSPRNDILKNTPQNCSLEHVDNSLATDTIPLTINRTNHNDGNIIPNLVDDNQQTEVKFDSEDSDIDVETVPEEQLQLEMKEINPIITTTFKAQQERMAREERRKLFKLLRTIIPQHINNRQDSASSRTSARDVLRSATEYIKILQSESQRLERKQDHLIEKKDSLMQKLSYLKKDVDIN